MAEPSSLYRCGAVLSAPCSTPSAHKLEGGIDVHCHVLVPAAEMLAMERPEPAAMRRETALALGEASLRHSEAMIGSLVPKLLDTSERLRDMDAMGISIQVISPSPTQYHYWADAEFSDRLVSIQNERIAAICHEHPDRFRAFGAVSLQSPELAARQLRQLMSSGFKGAEISSRIGDRELSDPALEPFWRAAAETDAVIFIHPLGTTLGSRLAEFYLENIVGQPLETTIALSRLILSGLFDRHPGLKVVAAHGGGFLPGYFGRLDHGWAVRPETKTTRERPSDYLRRIWFDTVVHDPALLKNLAAQAGVSQILLGTDYPFDMGEYRLGELLDGAEFGPDGISAIVSGNARRLLNI